MKTTNLRIYLYLLLAALALTVAAQPRGYGRRPTVIVHTGPRPMPPESRYHPYGWRTTYYGLRLGLNAASVRSDSPMLNGKGMKTGLNVGFVIGHQLGYTTPIFLEGGLYYSQKGGKSDNATSLSGRPAKFSYNLGYLELPIVLKYRHFTRSGLSVEPFAGGFLAVGVSGEVKDYADRHAFSSYDNGYFNRFDGGVRLGCGVGYGMGYAELSYDIGLANVGQDNFDNTRTGCLTVSVGVNF